MPACGCSTDDSWLSGLNSNRTHSVAQEPLFSSLLAEPTPHRAARDVYPTACLCEGSSLPASLPQSLLVGVESVAAGNSEPSDRENTTPVRSAVAPAIHLGARTKRTPGRPLHQTGRRPPGHRLLTVGIVQMIHYRNTTTRPRRPMSTISSRLFLPRRGSQCPLGSRHPVERIRSLNCANYSGGRWERRAFCRRDRPAQ